MLDLLKEHIASLNYGWVSFVFEVLIVIFAIIAISIILVRHVRSKHIFISYLVTLILLLISIIVGTTIGIYITLIAFILLSFMTILYYLPEYKKLFSKKIVRKPSKEFLSDQEVKEELIETLIKAAEHLANRKIGAIITIEKEHTLNTLVEGSVKLDALVTFELLETIFHPNTALHDGAVIIRGNRIKIFLNIMAQDIVLLLALVNKVMHLLLLYLKKLVILLLPLGGLLQEMFH